MHETKTSVPNVLKDLALLMGTEIKNGRLEIPDKFGSGYCAGYVFNENIRLLISHYQLHEEIVLKNQDIDSSKRMIFFKFQHIFEDPDAANPGRSKETMPSVLMATSRLNTDKELTIHSNMATVNIEVDASYLRGLFSRDVKSTVLHSLLENAQPLLFEQLVFPALKQVVTELMEEPVDEMFTLLFLRIKAEELICRLLMELKKREGTRVFALNNSDIQSVYKVKSQMLSRLNTPPVISALALGVHMSPSKLKRLFKQIFGNSLFSYYQEFRMKEAARLLKEEKLTVSSVGYQLGFTNLSHFSRIFQAHYGMKPKQYSRL